MTSTTEIGIAEALTALRQELAVAVAEGGGEETRFGVESVTLDMKVELKKSKGVGAGIKWVASVDGEASSEHTTTHTASLQLSVRTAAGEPLPARAPAGERDQ